MFTQHSKIVTKRRRHVLAVLLAAGLGLIAWLLCRTPEPVYQGKNLRHWLWEMEIAPDSASLAWKESIEAVRAMGTNALPTLLAMLRTPESAWKRKFVDWTQDALGLDLEDHLPEVRRRRALAGLRVLGTVAEPAIPQITKLVSAGDLQVSASALGALAEIGGPQTIAPLMAAVTNKSPQVSVPAAAMLGALRADARPAIPALLEALETSDAGLRASAARALGEIAFSPRRCVPALTKALGDSNSLVRFSAATALGQFGDAAESALPAIQALSVDGDEFARRAIPRAAIRVQCELRDGGIIRGPKSAKRLALVFTGHEYAEGAETILSGLARHQSQASFFLTGRFLINPDHEALLRRLLQEGHYLGPHSDRHLLYCAWEDRRTLVTEQEFADDLVANVMKIPSRFGEERRFNRYFLPPFEHYNRDIYDWSRKIRWTLINHTPGTRSNADYTGEADTNFVSSQAIFESIVQKEKDDPHGLNGFLLLLHLGSGPGRADKFHTRFAELLDYLAGKGYTFVRVDELLGPFGRGPGFPGREFRRQDGTPGDLPRRDVPRRD